MNDNTENATFMKQAFNYFFFFLFFCFTYLLHLNWSSEFKYNKQYNKWPLLFYCNFYAIELSLSYF